MLPVQRFLDNEIENEEKQYELRVLKKNLRDQSYPFNLPDQRFIELFRLSKDLVQYLFVNIVPHLFPTIRDTRVQPELRILIALRFLATGSYQRSTGEEALLSASQPVVSRCLEEVTEAIVHHLGNQWISYPINERRRQENKAGFMEMAGFPGVIGCIDCTHVPLIAPTDQEHHYMNRKSFHSKNVEIISNYNLEILHIDARFPGSNHDSFIWRSSEVKTLHEEAFNRGERNTWLLGDSGYPLQPWLLTPFQNFPDADTPEGRYNRALKLTRSTVERCIGVLKIRFRSIMGERELRYHPVKVGTIIINTCAILHNICIRARVPLPQDNMAGDDLFVFNVDNGNENNANFNVGEQIRQQVVQRYFN